MTAPLRPPSTTAKLDALAAVITGLDPDVLAVQEVGTPAALDDLAARLPGSWHTEVADPDGRGIRVGVLSRLPVLDVEQVRDYPPLLGPVQVDDAGTTLTQMGRPALRVRVPWRTSSGALSRTKVLDLVSVHLKSKLLSFPGGRFNPRDEDERARYAVYALHRRAAEAAAIRTYLTQVLGNDGQRRRVVLAGDLNDEPTAATTQILLGPPGSEIGTPGFGRADAGDAQRLWNLESLIPAADRFSRIYRGRGRTHRPPPGQSQPRRPCEDCGRRRTRPGIHHRQPRAPARRTGLRPPPGNGDLHELGVAAQM